VGAPAFSWTAQLSRFKRADDLSGRGAAVVGEAMIERLRGAIEDDERVVWLPIPDRLPMRVEIDRRPGERARAAAERARGPTTRYVMRLATGANRRVRARDRRLSRSLKQPRRAAPNARA
jgi:formamidopyrimidine-DNA glycosylase